MKTKLIILSIAILSWSGIARSQQQISGTQTRNGFDYSHQVSDDDLRDTPAWNPETGKAAPVSVSKAIEIARANLKRFAPESNEKWDVEKLILYQIGKEKWLYAVSFYCFQDRCDGDPFGGGFTIYVKMDGSIIEFEKTPNDGNNSSPKAKPNKSLCTLSDDSKI